MWGAVELLGHDAQELSLVLTAIVVGGADIHQLGGRRTGVGWGGGKKTSWVEGGQPGRGFDISTGQDTNL